MGLPASVLNNKLLSDFFAGIEAERRAKGRIDGRAALLRTLLEAKFGPLPEWAIARIADGVASQAEAWAKKALTARSLEAVIGPR